MATGADWSAWGQPSNLGSDDIFVFVGNAGEIDLYGLELGVAFSDNKIKVHSTQGVDLYGQYNRGPWLDGTQWKSTNEHEMLFLQGGVLQKQQWNHYYTLASENAYANYQSIEMVNRETRVLLGGNVGSFNATTNNADHYLQSIPLNIITTQGLVRLPNRYLLSISVKPAINH